MIIYIHGASATGESFTHIRDKIKNNDIVIEYSSSKGFKNNLSEMIKLLEPCESLFFVAHSLGGIYALHLADVYRDKTMGGVTLSTPYGGCRSADFAKYFLPFNRLMKDIGTMSKPMENAGKIVAPPNWTNVVTLKGQSPWIVEANDGVVTIDSMQAKKDIELVELDLNHYEVVISNRVVDIIQSRMKQANV